MSNHEECCIQCNEPVRPRQEGLRCDGCENWQHRKFNTGISQRAYREAVRTGGDIAWRCTLCTINMADLVPVAESSRIIATGGEDLEGEQNKQLNCVTHIFKK